MRIADMDKNSDDLTRRVWLELEKIYDGDRDRMRKAVDYTCGYDELSADQSGKPAKTLVEKIFPVWTFDAYQEVVRACKKIRLNGFSATTEPSPDSSPAPPPPKAYNQLTLDFSVTIEPTFPAPVDKSLGKPAPSPGENEKLSPVTFPNESIFLDISRAGTKKGWLSPQYKFKVGLYGNSSTTNPYELGRRVCGPYWIFCWNRPKKNDGRYYLGKVESPKFQHFCEIWKSSEDLSEILRRLHAR